MNEIVIASDDIDTIRRELLGENIESCAILFAHQVARSDGTTRFLVRQLLFPDQSDYTRKGPIEAELSPGLVARVTKRAKIDGTSLIFVHSHPGDGPPVFSAIDTFGERRLAKFLGHRHPAAKHLALVISTGGTCARELGTQDDVSVIGLGNSRDLLYDPAADENLSLDVYDRQVRAFGATGQNKLARLRVAIVGLGGTGSIVAQQLVHLGVRDFVFIDPDVVETTNLNRVVNASPSDIATSKVSVAERYVKSVSAQADVLALQGDVVQSRIARTLLDCDFIFACTDSHGSRAVIQQVSYQYLIPCIDMGTIISVIDHSVKHIYGRAQLLAPGFACLTCSELLNAGEVRRDMMTPFERKQDPYLQGAREPAPAVISLNGTIVSLAVTMFLSIVTGIPAAARHILYDAINSRLRSVKGRPDSNCYICSRSGSFARGDSWPLLARHD